MRFFDPTNTYAEKNCVKNHKKELLALGSRAFVITGHSSSKKNGSLDDVIAVLEEASVPYQIFNEIEENPSVETVVRAAEIGKEFKADFVIGIGGGSPLDASKAISLLRNRRLLLCSKRLKNTSNRRRSNNLRYWFRSYSCLRSDPSRHTDKEKYFLQDFPRHRPY